MRIEARSTKCWKFSTEDSHAHLPPGSNFHPNRDAVATGLTFVKAICTQPESKLPILMKNNKNHRITVPKDRIDFSSMDVSDTDEPKHQIRDPYELTKAILSTN